MVKALPKIVRAFLSVIVRGAGKTFDNAEKLCFGAELLAKAGATARALCLLRGAYFAVMFSLSAILSGIGLRSYRPPQYQRLEALHTWPYEFGGLDSRPQECALRGWEDEFSCHIDGIHDTAAEIQI